VGGGPTGRAEWLIYNIGLNGTFLRHYVHDLSRKSDSQWVSD